MSAPPRTNKVFDSADAVLDHFVRKQRKAGEGNDDRAWGRLMEKYWQSPIGQGWTQLEAAMFSAYTYTARPGRFARHADWGNVEMEEAA